MRKLILLMMIAATIIVPLFYAKDPKPARGHRRMLVAMAIIVFFWGVLLRFVYFAVSG